MTAAAEFPASVAGVLLPFPAMNAAGAFARAEDLRILASSRTGALVLKSTTVHPFVHPEFRSLHNAGFDKIVPLARELVGLGRAPVIASIAGVSGDEYATLARAFTEAGVAMVEVDVADPYVATTTAPFDAPGRLRELLGRLAGECGIPFSVKVPHDSRLTQAELIAELTALRAPVVVLKNDFIHYEKFLLEAEGRFDVIALGGVHSGYDLTRTLQKGAKAVQLATELVNEGPRIFARLEKELRTARATPRA